MYEPTLCTWCWDLYTPKRRDQRTCSKQCREALRNHEYRTANQDRVREWRREHYLSRRDYYLDKQKHWRAENPDEARRRDAASRAKNAEARRLRAVEYRARNAAAVRERNREWTARNPRNKAANEARRRSLRANAPGNATVGQIAARWSYYGGKCWVCGADATATDHVKPLAKGGSNWPANLRPICASCNSRKGAKWPYAA